MNLICYSLMGVKSRRCMARYKKWKKSRGGNHYRYIPRHELVQRLAKELGWTEQAVRDQIRKERLWLLRQSYGNGVKESEI